MSSKRKRRGDDEPTVVCDLSEYTCAICIEVQREPYELSCGHTFCKACIESHLHTSEACPVCREASSAPARPSKDLDARRRLSARCGGCGQTVPLLSYRSHTEQCQAHAEAEEAATTAAAATATAALGGRAPPPPPPNRSTFACPFCPSAREMARADLLAHLQREHAREGHRPAVCPVCAAMPWGDKNYRSPNLLQHFMLRHRFDYDTTTDLVGAVGADEDAVLAEVLRRSREEM